MSDGIVTLTLSRMDAGQIMDGLICRMESYQYTADVLSGDLAAENFIEEVSDVEEARTMVSIYSKLIDQIAAALNKAHK